MSVIGNENTYNELIPIEKLKDYLIWREKEFIEKYEGIRHNTENDVHATFEAQLKNGNRLIAVINSDLLSWDGKASHPWILEIEIKFYGRNNNGMPDEKTYALLNEFQNETSLHLKDFEGYINIGRETTNNLRNIYFACKDFRKPSKIVSEVAQRYSTKFEISYTIYKDKYWRSFNRFINNPN